MKESMTMFKDMDEQVEDFFSALDKLVDECERFNKAIEEINKDLGEILEGIEGSEEK